MFVRNFLKARTGFIRQFYDTASAPYLERKRKIEANEYPFVPPYSEDSEPPFLREWMEADESLRVLAYSCISMLSAALHLYMKTFEQQLHFPVDESLKREFKKNWLRGYRAYFARHLKLLFEDCPVDLQILEEVILARNRVQHPDFFIPTQRVSYLPADLEKISHPFFVDDRERALLVDVDKTEKSWLMPPTIDISAEKLAAAIQAMDNFGDWLEDRIDALFYGR